MKDTVYIISGGTIADTAWVKKILDREANATIICADGGARYCEALGLIPSVIIGDMDSIDDDLLSAYEAKGSEILRYPRSKNETDTELALIHALSLTPHRIRIVGALGSRIDHGLANISLLVAGVAQGVDIRIFDDCSELFVVNGSATIRGASGQTVSLLPLAEEATGITLSGFEYPLADARMEQGSPYGISNRLTGSEGHISVKTGYLLVIHYRQMPRE